ncbi:hypothetical protein WN943_026931 [Citrus x changshan-huyou]
MECGQNGSYNSMLVLFEPGVQENNFGCNSWLRDLRWSFCGDEGSNTSGERSFLFVEVVGTHDRKLERLEEREIWDEDDEGVEAEDEVVSMFSLSKLVHNLQVRGVPQQMEWQKKTQPQEFTLHTQQRAVKRAMFNYSVATKLYLQELQKKRVEKLQKMIEEEEIRLMRKEMIPRSQLMPLFDRPFFPQRSNRPLTVPREPSFCMANNKGWNCISDNEIYSFDHSYAWKPLK